MSVGRDFDDSHESPEKCAPCASYSTYFHNSPSELASTLHVRNRHFESAPDIHSYRNPHNSYSSHNEKDNSHIHYPPESIP